MGKVDVLGRLLGSDVETVDRQVRRLRRGGFSVTTYNEEKAFAQHMFNTSMLDKAVIWISENLVPEDVFDKRELLGAVRETFAPEDVFDKDDLAEWATDNGYALTTHEEVTT